MVDAAAQAPETKRPLHASVCLSVCGVGAGAGVVLHVMRHEEVRLISHRPPP